MKKILFGLLTVVGGAASVLSITAARRQDTIRPNTKVGPVQVGGLTPDEASRALRVWWETQKIQPLKVETPGFKKTLPDMKPGELGVTLDDVASVKDLPLTTFLGDAKATITQQEFPEENHDLLFRSNGLSLASLKNQVKGLSGPVRPAKVFFRKGAIVRQFEVAGVALNADGMVEAVSDAIRNGHNVQLPIEEAEKHTPDEDLKNIKQVVAEFSTRFSARNRPRSANIKLAASKIDGLVLMPGDQFSFNGIVGQRTLKAGFQVAGVYINGQHDTGVGGGICQVSTTLYNSALFANLKINRRRNHSLPVPYVPLGRDATVDWGNIDLVLENSYDRPIALTAAYTPGKLTFRVLGMKSPGLSVKVSQEGLRSWTVAKQEVKDESLPAGKTKVIKPGSTGHSVKTYRSVYQDGKLVRRELLGTSRYGGDAQVIAVGTGKPTPPPASNVPGTPEGAPAGTPPVPATGA